jgi:hypothetical protein
MRCYLSIELFSVRTSNKIKNFVRIEKIKIFARIAVCYPLFPQQNHSLSKTLLAAMIAISRFSYHFSPNFAEMVTGGPTSPVQPRLEFGLVTKKMVVIIFFSEGLLFWPHLVNVAISLFWSPKIWELTLLVLTNIPVLIPPYKSCYQSSFTINHMIVGKQCWFSSTLMPNSFALEDELWGKEHNILALPILVRPP